MNILKYEYIKLFQKKAIWVLILSLLAVNTFLFISDNYKKQGYIIKVKKEYETLLGKYAAMPRKEAAAELVSMQKKINMFAIIDGVFSSYSDEGLATENCKFLENEYPGIVEQYKKSEFYKQGERLRDYSICLNILNDQYVSMAAYDDFINTIEDKANEMTSSSIFNKEGTFAYRNILKTPEDFEHLKNVELQPGMNYGVLSVSKFKFTDFCIMAILLFLCIIIFLQESESRLVILLQTTKRGRLPVAVSKLFTITSAGTALAVIFYGSLVIIGGCLYGYGSLTRAIQSVAEFRECNLAITVGQYLLLFVCGKAAAVVFTALLFSFVFIAVSEARSIYMLIGAFLVVSYSGYYFIQPASVVNVFKYVNIFSAFDVYKFLGEYVNVNLFGYPVGKVPLTFGIGLAVAALSIFFSCLFYVKKLEPCISTFLSRIFTRLKLKPKKLRGNTSLLCNELYKVLVHNKALLVLAALIFFGYYNIDRTPLMLDQETAVYKTYVDKYGGELTPQKIEEIEKEKVFFNSISKQFAELSDKYAKGSISDEEFTNGKNLLTAASYNLKGFQRFYSQFEYVKFLASDKKLKGYLICSISTGELFDNLRRDCVYGILFSIALILCLSGIYPNDLKNGMLSVLRAAKRGKKELFIVKYLIGISMSLIVLVLVYAPLVISFIDCYYIADWNASIQNITLFSGTSWNMTILQFVIMEAAALLIGAACMSVIIIFVSQITKRQSAAIIASGFICILPILASMLKLPFVGFISFANTMTMPNSVMQYGVQVNLIYLAGLLIVTTGILAFSWRKYKLNS